MFKKILGQILGLGLVLFLFYLPCFAKEPQQQEPLDEISITTYYPSPYGSYNQLEVFRSLTFKPLADSDVVNSRLTNPRPGEMVYTDADKFYHYNGKEWVVQAESWNKCIGVCSQDNNPVCPAGYTKVLSGGQTGCQAAVDYGINPKIGGWWRVLKLDVPRSDMVYDSYEKLVLGNNDVCEVRCGMTVTQIGSTADGTTNYASGHAICCR